MRDDWHLLLINIIHLNNATQTYNLWLFRSLENVKIG